LKVFEFLWVYLCVFECIWVYLSVFECIREYLCLCECMYILRYTYTQIQSNTHITLTYTVFECMWVLWVYFSVKECFNSESMDFHTFDDHVETDPVCVCEFMWVYVSVCECKEYIRVYLSVFKCMWVYLGLCKCIWVYLSVLVYLSVC